MSAPRKPTGRRRCTGLPRGGHESTARTLIVEGKADVSAKDNDGLTPLHWAAVEGHKAMARTLIVEFKADVNAKDNDGWTPLHRAAAGGHQATARTLISYGATRRRRARSSAIEL